MGVFDTLIDGEVSCQCKAWRNRQCKNFLVGEKVPLRRSLTIVFPPHEGAIYALIENGIFKKLTNEEKETYPPYINKWGHKLSSPHLEETPFEL